MTVWQNYLSKLNSKRHVPSLGSSISGLERWFETPLGQQLLQEEKHILDEELSNMFGYHLLQLSINRDIQLFESSRIGHCFALGAGQADTEKSVQAYSALDALPLEDETVDVTVLHHVLEYSQNPHQVLREASRVTIARGYIVVFGFNPFSLMGVVKPLAQILSSRPIWKRGSLRKSRVSDWLQFLDFNTLRVYSGVYNPPLQNHNFIKNCSGINRVLSRWGVPFGNYYCLVARKDRACLTPLKPLWKTSGALVAPAQKRAISARSAARLAIVKDNKPSKPL